jgi:hypothetical protein
MLDNDLVSMRRKGGMDVQSIPGKRAGLLTQRQRAMQPNLGVTIGWIAPLALPNAGAGGVHFEER